MTRQEMRTLLTYTDPYVVGVGNKLAQHRTEVLRELAKAFRRCAAGLPARKDYLFISAVAEVLDGPVRPRWPGRTLVCICNAARIMKRVLRSRGQVGWVSP